MLTAWGIKATIEFFTEEKKNRNMTSQYHQSLLHEEVNLQRTIVRLFYTRESPLQSIRNFSQPKIPATYSLCPGPFTAQALFFHSSRKFLQLFFIFIVFHIDSYMNISLQQTRKENHHHQTTKPVLKHPDCLNYNHHR